MSTGLQIEHFSFDEHTKFINKFSNLKRRLQRNKPRNFRESTYFNHIHPTIELSPTNETEIGKNIWKALLEILKDLMQSAVTFFQEEILPSVFELLTQFILKNNVEIDETINFSLLLSLFNRLDRNFLPTAKSLNLISNAIQFKKYPISLHDIEGILNYCDRISMVSDFNLFRAIKILKEFHLVQKINESKQSDFNSHIEKIVSR